MYRDALHARSSGTSTGFGNDQNQVSINMPESFDMDTEVEGLRSQVGRLKQVQVAVTSNSFVPPGSELSCASVNLQVARAIGEENVLQQQTANSLVRHVPPCTAALCLRAMHPPNRSTLMTFSAMHSEKNRRIVAGGSPGPS